MGLFDKARNLGALRKRAVAAVDQHGDKIADGIDKAAGFADKQTKGKYSQQIAKGTAKAKEGLDNLDGRRDDVPPDNPPTTYPRTEDKP